MRSRLFTPGPTEIPEAVRLAAAARFPYHRGPEFKKLFQEVQAGLQYFFQTKQQVLLLTASGTGGMEACVSNLFSAGETVLVLAGGKFGERWAELGRAFGLQVMVMEVPWGQPVDYTALENLVKTTPHLCGVFCTHSETSTGSLTDVQRVAAIVRRHSGALIIVDGVTAVGVLPFYFDEWQIDACVSGSQKGAMAPPGLAFVALSERAWQKHSRSTLPRFYFDFTTARQAAQEQGTSWTPAITAIVSLAESLRRIQTNSLEFYWKHYARLATAFRAGVQALGLALFPTVPSNALTAVTVPAGVEGKTLVSRLREGYGVTVAGGQGQLKGKIFRVSHMGDYDHLDQIGLMAALEMALAEAGWRFDWGAGLATMQHAYNQMNSARKDCNPG
ncbi:MAG: alanine--glyoxylate aminotransferase family protein [candidate division KSB1 bacterium]|nr:alanine--glyoxylate aminotransferase family protein [candidate division KSB1 bacterium]MDZ7273623.1 alanine--glyoxylate aminotransferase family protein [candidate division KSB1 bacterium]MDZ7286786.1 alanine--glyoxylate aminotransferase family protein [candidate division KSB1 bacterium]MDZ7299857.1 alanine--glyoxylate aminotransferase family protein [candidate division KSB1 bacterium]MDZ7305794.1 alanine--glyoxylate aminotransferase family protein [candidate division KSB1 bacterium]